MGHYIYYRETLVRQLCKFEVYLHQIVAGTKSERKPTGKDYVYCLIQHGVRRRISRACSKCEGSLCLLACNYFIKFQQMNFTATRNQWLQFKHVSSPLSQLLGRPMCSTVPKGHVKCWNTCIHFLQMTF